MSESTNPNALRDPAAPASDKAPQPEQKPHDPSTDDSTLESIGKAVSAPVLGAADEDPDDPTEAHPS